MLINISTNQWWEKNELNLFNFIFELDRATKDFEFIGQMVYMLHFLGQNHMHKRKYIIDSY